MNYPLISEYIEAIKSAEDNFEELSYLRPVLDDDGLPVMSAGGFSVVFKMKDEQSGKLYAVKCFTKEQEGRSESYKHIADELEFVSSNYLTPIRFLEKELFVDTDQTTETEFPVLLMDWVEGKALDKYLRENLDDKYALEMLAYRFCQLAQWLIPQPFAHGDLKPDNILVREDGSLVLVDYDGMYVPAMKGQKARELGSPDFRHPKRTENDFDEHIDDLPLVSMLLSLKAISINSHWLNEYGAKDRLLFSSNDYYNIIECRFLREQIPSGNKVLDKYAYLFCAVCYDEQLSPQLFSFIPMYRPFPLVPFKMGKNCYSLYDKVNQKLLSLQYKYINFVDSSLETSTSCILSNVYGSWDAKYRICGGFKSAIYDGYKKAAIVSRPHDLLNLHWYERLLNIGDLRTRFIAMNSFGKYGIIDDQNNILLDFVFNVINPIEVEEDVYLICQKGDCYGVLNIELKLIIPCILLELRCYYDLKLITYKNEKGSSFARDLTTLKECKLPNDVNIRYDYLNIIYDYKEGILTFEIAKEQYRFFSFEKQEYINSYTYQGISDNKLMIIKKSFVLCKRGQSLILLAIDGTEYPINFKGTLSQYGETVIGVNPIEEKYIGQDGFEHAETNYEVSVFKKNILLSKFIYDKIPYYDETFTLVGEDVISVWHWVDNWRGGYAPEETRINLKGEQVPLSKTEVSATSKKTTEGNTRLTKIVKEKYLNSTFISNFDSFEVDECNFFNIKILDNLAFVSFHWDAGDDEGHCGTIEIGYADEDMCYWSKDCMNNQI